MAISNFQSCTLSEGWSNPIPCPLFRDHLIMGSSWHRNILYIYIFLYLQRYIHISSKAICPIRRIFLNQGWQGLDEFSWRWKDGRCWIQWHLECVRPLRFWTSMTSWMKRSVPRWWKCDAVWRDEDFVCWCCHVASGCLCFLLTNCEGWMSEWNVAFVFYWGHKRCFVFSFFDFQ